VVRVPCRPACAVRMRWLVENVLGLAKIEAGEHIDIRPFDLADMVGDVVESLDVMAARNKVRVVLCELSSIPYVGNEQLLWLAVANLINNAIKFSPGGEVSVKLKEEDGTAVIKVSDNGIGMSKETQAVIFQRFRQGDGSDTRRYGGTGIGLFFADLVAKFHSGRIEVESEPGKGSTFRLILPLGGRP